MLPVARLHAQAEDSTVVSAVVEDDDPANFDSISTDDAVRVEVRSVDRSALKSLQEDDDFWYHNTAPAAKKIVQKKKPQEYKPSKWLPYLLWSVVIGGFIAFLVWFLMSSNVKFFKSSSKRVLANVEAPESEDIFEINFDSKIAAAVHAKNYRMAIRLMYLQLLSALSRKEIIQYAHQKTNNDYVKQLYGTGYYKSFFQLTRHFEYTWYGKFPLSEERFGEMKGEFDDFKNGLKA